MVSVGITTWKTSIFYERKKGTYLLPIKGEVRAAEGIKVDDIVRVRIEILV
jgi:hypothetical protein